MKQKVARLLCAVLIGVLMMTAVAPVAMAASKTARIIKTTKIYQSPSKSSKSMKTSPKTVTVKSTSNGWAKISYKNKTAYIPVKYLSLSKPIKVYVTTSTAKLYSKAGSGQLGRVTLGTTLYYVGSSGKYALVQNSSGKARGYVLASCLSTTKPSKWTPAKGSTSKTTLGELPEDLIASSTSSDLIEKVIAVAQSKMGAKYVHNSKGPDTFDCAGFTYYCYKKGAGIKLSGSSQGQGYDDDYPQIDDIGDLERGDLVCFDTDESDDDLSDHVGIYMGNGWFIHASSAAGQVIISRLDTGYYERVVSWGRRIIG